MGFEIIGYKWTIGRDFWLVGHWVWQNTVESNHSGLSMIWASKVLMTYSQEQFYSVRSYSILLCSLITQFAYYTTHHHHLMCYVMPFILGNRALWNSYYRPDERTFRYTVGRLYLGKYSAGNDVMVPILYYIGYYMYMVIYRLYMKSATPLWLDFDRV